jgi:hypothetical protein
MALLFQLLLREHSLPLEFGVVEHIMAVHHA